MLKKILIINGALSLVGISCNSVPLNHPAFSYEAIQKEYSHPNLTENAYFSNEIQKALADYREENEALIAHTHTVAIANVEDGFLFPVGDEVVQEKQLNQIEFILKNDFSFTQDLEISDLNLTNQSFQTLKKVTSINNSSQINFSLNNQNYQFKLNEKNEVHTMKQQTPVKWAKTVPGQTTIKVKYTLMQKTYSQKYNYLLPIENDKWCKQNIGMSGKVYQISPQELFYEIKDSPELLNYYFGLNEFYQYRNFIGKSDSPYLVWAATRIVSIQVAEIWNEEIKTISNF